LKTLCVLGLSGRIFTETIRGGEFLGKEVFAASCLPQERLPARKREVKMKAIMNWRDENSL
jgi:hypothetical protein